MLLFFLCLFLFLLNRMNKFIDSSQRSSLSLLSVDFYIILIQESLAGGKTSGFLIGSPNWPVNHISVFLSPVVGSHCSLSEN